MNALPQQISAQATFRPEQKLKSYQDVQASRNLFKQRPYIELETKWSLRPQCSDIRGFESEYLRLLGFAFERNEA